MSRDASYEMSEATQTGLEMQGRDWRIENGFENPDDIAFCGKCQDYTPHYEEDVKGHSVLFCEECTEDSFETWTSRIGSYIKFVDEEAIIEAQADGTKYPKLYHGTLRDILPISIYGSETLYAKIEPRWTTKPKFVPVSQVRLVD